MSQLNASPLKDVSLTELLAVSKCHSQSTKLTEKLRQLIQRDHEVYKQEKMRRHSNSENSILSVVRTGKRAYYTWPSYIFRISS